MCLTVLFLTLFLFVSCTQSDADILKKAGYEADGTGFLEAVKNDDGNAADIFLKMPELLNFADKSGRTAVMLAAGKKNPAMLEKLIKAGANLKIMDNSEKTPLHYAAAGNSVENVRILLENGGDANLTDNYGRDVPNTLLNFVNEENIELFRILIDKSNDLERRDKDKKTLLIIAAEKGFSEYLKILAGRKVSPLPKDFKGRTAFDYAAESYAAGKIDGETFTLISDYTQKIKDNL